MAFFLSYFWGFELATFCDIGAASTMVIHCTTPAAVVDTWRILVYIGGRVSLGIVVVVLACGTNLCTYR